jgi:hypothetical protein
MNNQVIALDADGVLLDYKAKRAYLLEKVKRVDFPSETEDLRPKTYTRIRPRCYGCLQP